MKIYCTVLRKDGSYKTVAVKAGKDEFELDKQKYYVRGFRIGRLGPLRILRAVYVEGYPLPVDWPEKIDELMEKAKLKIDTKAVKHLTNKKILSVYGDAEFTRLEEIFIMLSMATLGIGAANLIMIIFIFEKLSSVIP